MATDDDHPGQPERIDRRRLFLGLGINLLFLVLCLFPPAGTWTWTRGWLFILVIVGVSILATLYLRRVNPEVIAARINRHKGTKPWDRLLLAIFFPTVLAIPNLAALDDGRFHWFSLPWWGCVLGYALFISTRTHGPTDREQESAARSPARKPRLHRLSGSIERLDLAIIPSSPTAQPAFGPAKPTA